MGVTCVKRECEVYLGGHVGGYDTCTITYFHLFCCARKRFHVDIVYSVVADSFARNVRRQTSLMHIAQVGCA